VVDRCRVVAVGCKSSRGLDMGAPSGDLTGIATTHPGPPDPAAGCRDPDLRPFEQLLEARRLNGA
jgi:hypothetical protein